MISFVNIRTGRFFDFRDWDEIRNLGGLKNILPEGEYNDIYNEGAILESVDFHRSKLMPIKELNNRRAAEALFESRNANLQSNNNEIH